MSFQAVFALTAATVAVMMDISKGKVRNWWICMLWIVGFMYQCHTGRITFFLWGSLMPILVLFPLFRFRMLGAGDIKLFSVLGGVIGAEAVGVCMVVSFLCGGVLSLGILLIWGNLFSRLRYFAGYIQLLTVSKKIQPYYRVGAQVENMHFTVAILMGVILYAGGMY